MSLRMLDVLPRESIQLAELIEDNQPLEKDELNNLVKEHDKLEIDNLEKNIRLLRMSENLVIENEKGRIDRLLCGEKGRHVMEKFRRWKRKAQKQ